MVADGTGVLSTTAPLQALIINNTAAHTGSVFRIMREINIALKHYTVCATNSYKQNMRHKRQITLLLLFALLVAWGGASSSHINPAAQNPAVPTAMPRSLITPLAKTTVIPATSAPGQPRRTPLPLGTPREVATPASLNPYAGALLPSYEGDVGQAPDATRYDIDITIDADMQHVYGAQQVVVVNHAADPLTELMLRLYPNTEYLGGSMHVQDVHINGASVLPIPYVRAVAGSSVTDSQRLTDTSVVSIPLNEPVLPGHAVSLSLEYVITAPLRSNSGYRTFGWVDQVLALPDAYAMIPVHDQRGWRVDAAPDYGDIVFAEASLYRVRITAPSDLVIVATGACTQTPLDPQIAPPSDVLLHQSVTSCVAGPVRDFAIHASREYRVVSAPVAAAGGDVLVSSYYLPGNQQAAQHVLDYASAALLFYESRFGVYPYKELKVFPSGTTAGGIEYPMLAGVLDTLYSGDPGYLEWIVAHEVAHQWWYGMLGSDQINEPWLDESLAQYSTLLYMEQRHGADYAAGLREQRLIARYHAELDAGKDTIVDQPTLGFDRALYFPIVYGKGPLFYDEVRRTVGDARFILWLHTYFEKNRYGIVHREDLLTVADDLGMGVTVRQAFDKWMHGVFIR